MLEQLPKKKFKKKGLSICVFCLEVCSYTNLDKDFT